MPEPVSLSLHGPTAHVLLDQPERLNALTPDTLDALIATAGRIRSEIRSGTGIRAVVLSGAGRSFCSGLDLPSTQRAPARLAGAFIPRPWRGTNTFQEAAWVWRRLPVPVIAAVHGHCYGGGLQIALGADIRLATGDSRWSVLEASWGLIPDMTGMRTLTELVGLDQAKRLTFTAEEIDGTEAHRLGLVTGLHQDPVSAAANLADQLAERSPAALAAAKRLLNRAGTSSTRRLFARERLEQLRLLRGVLAGVSSRS